jgi:negative modulator of initiation of replication
MKTIELDDDLYGYIASQTQHIGESASDILRRLLKVDEAAESPTTQEAVAEQTEVIEPEPSPEPKGIVVGKEAAYEEKVDNVKYLRELLISDELASKSKAIDRFMLVLSELHIIEPEKFAEATQVKGRKRIYFADNEDVLLASGNTTKPRAIPNSPFWVITNNNTLRKRQMVVQLMERMAFPADITEKVSNAI